MTTRIEEIKQVKGSLKALYAVSSPTSRSGRPTTVVLPMVGMGGPMW